MVDYRDVIRDDNDLALFLRNMRKFDQRFVEAMTSKVDFTMRFEVHGNQGELLHCRVSDDGFDRPKGVEKRIDARMKMMPNRNRLGGD